MGSCFNYCCNSTDYKALPLSTPGEVRGSDLVCSALYVKPVSEKTKLFSMRRQMIYYYGFGSRGPGFYKVRGNKCKLAIPHFAWGEQGQHG